MTSMTSPKHSWSPNTDHQAIPDDPVLGAIARYSSYSSVVKIKKVFGGNSFRV